MATQAFDTNLKGLRQIIGDYSRAYMFRLNIPAWVTDNKVLSVFARSTTLPDYTINTAPIGFQGLKMNVATTATFNSPWALTVLSDENNIIRGNLLKWGSYTYDAGTMEASTIGAYKSDIVVAEQLDRTGKTIMTYNFYGAFPQNIGGPTFNHDEVNPQTFNASLAYDFFTIAIGSTINMQADNQIPAIDIQGNIGSSADAARQAGQNKPPQLNT